MDAWLGEESRTCKARFIYSTNRLCEQRCGRQVYVSEQQNRNFRLASSLERSPEAHRYVQAVLQQVRPPVIPGRWKKDDCGTRTLSEGQAPITTLDTTLAFAVLQKLNLFSQYLGLC